MLIARRIGNTQKTVILELVVHVKAVVLSSYQCQYISKSSFTCSKSYLGSYMYYSTVNMTLE